MKTRIVLKLFVFTILVLSVRMVQGQSVTVEVLTSRLIQPNKVILAGDTSLLVSEAGTVKPNTGRISLINRVNGNRRTLINGLPSGVNDLGGSPSPSGPSGLDLRGRILYITIGVGDAVEAGAGPGLEFSNPNPSSQLYNSVLKLTLPYDFENLSGKFSLTAENQQTLVEGRTVVLTNAGGQNLRVELVINLPDFTTAPTPTAPNNVKASNLYGVASFKKELFLVDAGQNRITRVKTDGTGKKTFVSFDSKPNPAYPALGGPEVEAVPVKIRRIGGRMMLVPLLTGFPFVQGLSDIRSVSLTGGERKRVFIPNLTSAIDIAQVSETQYFTLEYSANQLENAPGRLRYYRSLDHTSLTLVSDLISPTSMAFDHGSTIYVTSTSTGKVLGIFVNWWGY